MMPKDVTEMLIELEKVEGHNIVWQGARAYTMRKTYAGELPGKRPKLSKRRKQDLYFKQHQECNDCHRPFKLNELVVDEFIPVSRGGNREKGNIQLLCAECNGKKGNKTPSQVAKETGVGITEQIQRLPVEEDI